MHTPFTHLHAGTVAALTCTMSHTHKIAASDASTIAIRQVTIVLSLFVLHLPTVQESSAASHKCHSRVRHFGRVFTLLYKKIFGVSLHLSCSVVACYLARQLI
jgi:hypothetical protein